MCLHFMLVENDPPVIQPCTPKNVKSFEAVENWCNKVVGGSIVPGLLILSDVTCRKISFCENILQYIVSIIFHRMVHCSKYYFQ